jgi:hypothetical protein
MRGYSTGGFSHRPFAQVAILKHQYRISHRKLVASVQLTSHQIKRRFAVQIPDELSSCQQASASFLCDLAVGSMNLNRIACMVE